MIEKLKDELNETLKMKLKEILDYEIAKVIFFK